MTGLDSINLTFLVVAAFGAAAVGAFASIPLTYLGGLLIGIGAAISTKYVVDVSWLEGLPSSLPFMVLFVALFVVSAQGHIANHARYVTTARGRIPVPYVAGGVDARIPQTRRRYQCEEPLPVPSRSARRRR